MKYLVMGAACGLWSGVPLFQHGMSESDAALGTVLLGYMTFRFGLNAAVEKC